MEENQSAVNQAIDHLLERLRRLAIYATAGQGNGEMLFATASYWLLKAAAMCHAHALGRVLNPEMIESAVVAADDAMEMDMVDFPGAADVDQVEDGGAQ